MRSVDPGGELTSRARSWFFETTPRVDIVGRGREHMRLTNLRVMGATAILLAGCPVDEDDKDDSFGFVDSEGMGTVTPNPTNGAAESSGGPGGSETSGASNVTATGGESTGDAGECGAAAHCASPAPDGWMGPIAVHRGSPDGSEAVPCGEGFPSAGPTLLEGFNAPGPTVCDCECTINLANLCNVFVYDYGAMCTGFLEQLTLDDECSDLSVTGGTAFFLSQQGQPFCQPQKTDTKPDVVWDSMVSSCSGAVIGDECSTGVCTPNAPEGYEASLCIFTQGVAECPAGDFSQQYVLNNGTDDTRNCSNCICGTGTASCQGTLDVFASNDCTGAPQASLSSNFQCNEGSVGAASMMVNLDADPTCPVETMPEPVGEVVPAGEFTYCCEAV